MNWRFKSNKKQKILEIRVERGESYGKKLIKKIVGLLDTKDERCMDTWN